MSILKLLNDEQVLFVKLSRFKDLLTLTEGCDDNYSVDLDKGGVKLLIAELEDIYDAMVYLDQD